MFLSFWSRSNHFDVKKSIVITSFLRLHAFLFDCYIPWHLGHTREEKYYLHRKSFLIQKVKHVVPMYSENENAQGHIKPSKDRQQNNNNQINLSKMQQIVSLYLYNVAAVFQINAIFRWEIRHTTCDLWFHADFNENSACVAVANGKVRMKGSKIQSSIFLNFRNEHFSY